MCSVSSEQTEKNGDDSEIKTEAAVGILNLFTWSVTHGVIISAPCLCNIYVTEIIVDEKTISRFKKQTLSLSNSVVYLPNTRLCLSVY